MQGPGEDLPCERPVDIELIVAPSVKKVASHYWKRPSVKPIGYFGYSEREFEVCRRIRRSRIKLGLSQIVHVGSRLLRGCSSGTGDRD
jgi:hypothetical protein